MITPDALLPLWEAHRAALEHPVRTIEFPAFDRVFDVARNIVRNDDTAAEVAQDVFLEVLRVRVRDLRIHHFQ